MLVPYILMVATLFFSILAWEYNYFFSDWAFRPFLMDKKGEWIRAISHVFIHFNYIHLFFNMFAVYNLSGIVDHFLPFFGWRKEILFLQLYFGAALLNALFSYFRNRYEPFSQVVGASASISALLSFIILHNPHMNMGFFLLPVGIPGYVFLPLFLMKNFFLRDNRYTLESFSFFIGGLYGILFYFLIQNNIYFFFFFF